MAHDHRSERPTRRGRSDDSGGDTDAGNKLYYHLTLLAESEHRLPQPHPAGVAGVPRGLLLQAATRLGAARRTRRGVIATTGCLGGHVLQALLRDDVAGGHREGGPAAGHLRPRQPVRRAAGPRHPGAAPDQSAADRARPPHRRPAARHQRLALHPPRGPRGPRRPAVRADRLDALRPEAVQVRGPGALPQDAPTRCATCSATTPRRATTRCGSPSGPTSRSRSARSSCPTSRSPRGSRAPTSTSPTSRGRAPVERWGERAPRRRRRARHVRARHDRLDGLLGVLPHRLGPHRPRPAQRHPRRAGSRVGGRVRRGLLPADHRSRPDPLRPAVRALPQPEPHLDARHRHGLRLPVPGRDDPLRLGEVRARPRRPDHHVRHDQGAQRRPRRRARARACPTPSATASPRRCRRW